MTEPWLEPYAYTTQAPIDRPPYWRNVQAVAWERAARAEHGEVERLRALLTEVAELGDVEHDPDGDCRGNWDDEPCDPGCYVADHNAVMARVRAAVAAK